MVAQSPIATTVRDLCNEALRDCGAIGIGQSPLAEDTNGAWIRLQWMLQQWQQGNRYLVYHMVTYTAVATGNRTYSVGPTGGPGGTPDISIGTYGLAARPNQIASGFLRQLVQSQPNQIDYPLTLLQSMEDYNRIALKGLISFPGAIFYDPGWGPSQFGTLYPWPVPQANIYALGITVKETLPASFPSLSTEFVLPYEYYLAMESNLAIMLRPKYGLGTFPGDMLPSIAKNALQVLRQGNTQVKALDMPADLGRGGIYNIFSDRNY